MRAMQNSVTLSSLALLITLVGATACAPRSLPKTSPGGTPPDQPIQSTLPIEPSTSNWSFQNDTHPYHYRLTNVTTLKLQADTAQPEDTVTSSVTFALVLDTSSPVYTISGEITQTSTQGGNRIGRGTPHQVLPISFTGSYDNNQLQIHLEGSRPSAVPCSDTITTQLARLYNQLNRIPPVIQKGTGWRDSLTVHGCQGPVPTETSSIRHYEVVGEAVLAGQRVVLIQRSDSIQTTGEGSQGQHHISFESRGTAETRLLLGAATGRLVASDAEQVTSILTRVSGRLLRFTQQTRETVRLVP